MAKCSRCKRPDILNKDGHCRECSIVVLYESIPPEKHRESAAYERASEEFARWKQYALAVSHCEVNAERVEAFAHAMLAAEKRVRENLLARVRAEFGGEQ